MTAADGLTGLIAAQRWFGSKSRELATGQVVDSAALPADGVLALWCAEFADGGDELYQLPYRLEAGEPLIDLADAVLAHALLSALRAERSLATDNGRLEFELSGPLPDPSALAAVRPVGGEQSNSSVVFGERCILKAYRRLEPGESAELELLRFLTAHGFEHTPRLLGWYAYSGPATSSTLGILQTFVPGSQDGWELALESAHDPGPFIPRLRRLGEVTARMHCALACEQSDPAFRPEPPTGDASIAEAAALLAGLPQDGPAEPIRARSGELLERLHALNRAGLGGLAIRQHGDYHLGQVLWTGDDWLVLDFEGEPARPLAERRRKSTPLRDVAGVLRSLAYAAETARGRGTPFPPGWESEARASFLGGYESAIDATLLPPARPQRDQLLAACELEKAIYELRYELDNRPDWVRVPVAGLLRLLDGRS